MAHRLAVLFVVLMLSIFVSDGSAGTAAASDGGDAFRVVSFNIRFGTANDGPDHWDNRHENVAETIHDLDGAVVGLQEAMPFQIRRLLAALPRYAATGVSREDGRIEGEACPILYDRTRLTLADAGTFWLSDTPDDPGSNTWGAACNRVCSWARFVDLETGDALVVLNTHWDHVSQPAREKSAALLLRKAAEISGDDPFVVTGDLNAGEDNAAIATLLGGSGDVELIDTYRDVHPAGPNAESAGTFTGFKTASDGGANKIDYVLTSPGWKIVDAAIDRRKIDGRYPSDHFPVWAQLVIED